MNIHIYSEQKLFIVQKQSRNVQAGHFILADMHVIFLSYCYLSYGITRSHISTYQQGILKLLYIICTVFYEVLKTV